MSYNPADAKMAKEEVKCSAVTVTSDKLHTVLAHRVFPN